MSVPHLWDEGLLDIFSFLLYVVLLKRIVAILIARRGDPNIDESRSTDRFAMLILVKPKCGLE